VRSQRSRGKAGPPLPANESGTPGPHRSVCPAAVRPAELAPQHPRSIRRQTGPAHIRRTSTAISRVRRFQPPPSESWPSYLPRGSHQYHKVAHPAPELQILQVGGVRSSTRPIRHDSHVPGYPLPFALESGSPPGIPRTHRQDPDNGTVRPPQGAQQDGICRQRRSHSAATSYNLWQSNIVLKEEICPGESKTQSGKTHAAWP